MTILSQNKALQEISCILIFLLQPVSVDHLYLDKCTNHAQTCEAKIFKRSCLACGVQEWVQKQGNMCYENNTRGIKLK